MRKHIYICDVLYLHILIYNEYVCTCMHEPVKLPCLFGCRDAPDELLHYLYCTPLWLIAGEVLGLVPPLDISERLCIAKPSEISDRMLALCFQIYHFAKSNWDGTMNGQRIQRGLLRLTTT